MTIYFIYKNEPPISPFLYAFTTKKYLRDSFKEERKKDIFVIKEKEISKQEYKNLLQHNKQYELGRRGYETKASSSSLSKKVQIYLTSTEYEEMDVFVKADHVFTELGKYTDPYAKAFNSDVLRALHNLHYFEIMKFCDADDYFLGGISEFSFERASNVNIDSFSIFMKLYGSTLDLKNLLKAQEQNKDEW